MSKGLQIAIAALTVFAGAVWLVSVAGTGGGTFRYYANVADFAAEPHTGDARVHGFVLVGSIQKDLPAGYVDFVIQDDSGATLPVRLTGIELPDLFKDGAEVVVEGRYEGNRFLAKQVLAKCPSKYEAEGSEA